MNSEARGEAQGDWGGAEDDREGKRGGAETIMIERKPVHADDQIRAILAHMAQQQSSSTPPPVAYPTASTSSIPPPDVHPLFAPERPREGEQRRFERDYVDEEQPVISPVKPARRKEPAGKKEKLKVEKLDNGEESKETAADYSRTKKDNHKEVERRRRETINDGINTLRDIVPNCEKNKGSILSRAAEYIQELKDSEASNIEKWTLEKLLGNQAMEDSRREIEALEGEVDHLREVLHRYHEKFGPLDQGGKRNLEEKETEARKRSRES